MTQDTNNGVRDAVAAGLASSGVHLNGVIALAFVLSLQLIAATALAQTADQSTEPTNKPSSSQVTASDGQLGSAMTLQQLTLRTTAKDRADTLSLWKLKPAAEPIPALKYSFWYSRNEQIPGTATLHWSRALAHYLVVPQSLRAQMQRYVAVNDSTNSEAKQRDLKRLIESFETVYDSIHHMALSQHLDLDDGIRNLSGLDVFNYQLEHVQEARSLARLLVLKAQYQRETGDFEGLQHTMADGFRLAKFLGDGETLIHQLVGIAIARMMTYEVEHAIRTGDCPNLYWALASIPRPYVSMNNSIEFELSTPWHVFPALAEAETSTWTAKQAADRWTKLIDDLAELDSENSSDANIRYTLAAGQVTFVEPAKKRLLAHGVTATRLKQLPDLQIILFDASIELRKYSDATRKGTLLPDLSGRRIVDAQRNKMEKWVKQNRASSVGASIAHLLFPPVKTVTEADRRVTLFINRLMTVEAIRMHVSKHKSLPATLNELSTTVALPNVYNGKNFGYRIDVVDGIKTAVLTMDDAPDVMAPWRELKLQFAE